MDKNNMFFINIKMTKYHPSFKIKQEFENKIKKYHNEKVIKPYKQIPKNANIPLRGIMLPHQSVSGNAKYIKQNGRIKLVSHLR